jgi:hypothetical protein
VSVRAHYTHELVERFPDEPVEGVLYVSMEFATTMHLCMCGCGETVITPLTPTDWRITYDGETVSLAPSVGNWSMRCESHYWLQDGRVRWSGRWSVEQIAAGRAHDRRVKAHSYGEAPDDVALQLDVPEHPPAVKRLLRRLGFCRR